MKNNIPTHFLEFFERRGVSTVQLNDEFEGYKQKRKTDNWKDFIWFKLQQCNFDISMKANDVKEFYKNQSDVLLEMTYLRRKYEKQKANELFEIFLQYKVEYMDCSNLQMQFAIVPDKRCSYAMRHKDQWCTKRELLSKIKLLGNNCQHPLWCTCAVVCTSLRDNEGVLLKKK